VGISSRHTMTLRRFTLTDQFEFANLSHDFNPIHVDPIASRRLVYGQPVVHGVNALLWALATFASGIHEPIKVLGLSSSFAKPILLDEDVVVNVDTAAAEKAVIRLSQRGQTVAKVKLIFAPLLSEPLAEFSTVGQSTSRFSTLPDVMNEADLTTLEGGFTMDFDREKAIAIYGQHLLAIFGSQAIAEITALTKVVGMHAPGLHSLLTEVSVSPVTLTRQTNRLEYKIQEYDQRFRQLVIDCKAKIFDARLTAFFRPPAVLQDTYSILKQEVLNNEFASQRALIIGGSRGLGEVAAKYLAAGGAQVLLTYSQGGDDAAGVVDDINLHGGNAKMASLDLTSFSELDLGVFDEFAPDNVYFFATPFIFAGQKDIFDQRLFRQFMEFYLLGFQKVVTHFSQRGTLRYFWPSSVALNEWPVAMGEYCIAKSAAEAYSEWVVRNTKNITISFPRLPRLATDQTASIARSPNGDTVLILELLRDFSKLPSRSLHSQ
jgi:acyl dehydratase